MKTHRTTQGRTARPRRWTLLALGALVALTGALAPTPTVAQQPAINNTTGDEEVVELTRFAEPVDLRVLIDYISERLDVNILIDPGLSGQTVAISGPMAVPRSKLFEFLQLILEPNGFVVTFEPELDTYNIRAGADVPLNLEGELATTTIIPTPLVTPSSLQSAITSALGDTPTMRVSYMDELGVIIATGSPRANRQLRLIVDQLLSRMRDQRINVFFLEHIAAAEARDRLLSIVGGGGAATGGAQRQGGAAQGGAATAGGAMSNLDARIIIPSWGNQIIYKGTEQEASDFAEHLAIVDVPNTLTIERYSAGAMVAQITSIASNIGLGPVSGAGASATTGAAFNAGRAQAGGQTGGGAVGGSRFVVEDAESGVFLYYGTEAQHQVLQTIIDKYAGQTTPDLVVVEFYKLKHSSAEDVADVLSGLLDVSANVAGDDSPFLPPAVGDQRGINRLSNERLGATEAEDQALEEQRQQAEETGAATLGDTEGISITADEPNNQIIVRATMKQQADVARIIDDIDQRRPQVYIDVQIVSVTASNTFNLTVETSLTNPDSDVPLFTNFGLADPRDTLIEPVTGITSALIRNDYVPIIINALATDLDGRVISSPGILVNNNETADISKTENEAFAQTTQTAGSPSQTSVGGSVSAGTTLTVTPQISSGGYINLEYSVELSSFTGGSRDNLPRNTLTNNFNSRVSVPAGTTVVVGGIVDTSTNVTVSKVPLLGDIPLLGLLFQSREERDNNQTIYVFITPKILRDPSFQDLRLLTAGPRDQVELPADLPEIEPAVIPVLPVGSDLSRNTNDGFRMLTPPKQETSYQSSALPTISPSAETQASPVRAPGDDQDHPARERDDMPHAITSQRGSPL